MNKECIIPGCQTVSHAHGWCRKHYTRWRAHGNPHTVLVGGIQPNLLPNPWAEEAPACPRGCPPIRVYLWAAEGTLRWMCAEHQIRFDAPTSQAPQTALVSGT